MHCVLQLDIFAMNDARHYGYLLFWRVCLLCQPRLRLFDNRRELGLGTSCIVGHAAKQLAFAHGTHVAYHRAETPMDAVLQKDPSPALSMSVRTERPWLKHRSTLPQSRRLQHETSKTRVHSSTQLHADIWTTVGAHLVVTFQSSHPTTTKNLL